MLLKIFKYWRKWLGFVCFWMPTFIRSHKLLKARMEEPSLSPLCSDKLLHLTHLLLNWKQLTFCLKNIFQKVLTLISELLKTSKLHQFSCQLITDINYHVFIICLIIWWFLYLMFFENILKLFLKGSIKVSHLEV